ncbi:hypothetical protein DYE49_11410 [Treponema rectale]|uniref:Outer membrane protein beta-barrel domain-containing protein n=1 Tax=Treponema rectale TaxID=744512 RepID=A0A840SE90_9SPIR|nr:hypothetical protein [Treponema rectale]MBB5219075.1 hypothetical protein [Treponema rectale]QOS41020.1 hypothetical protein DYE49_11410 [Treponema rectale]
MKKIISMVAAALISVTAAFAENTFHLGAYFPIYSFEVDDTDISSTIYGASFDYIHVAESGYTWKIGLECGKASTSDLKSVVKGEDLTGFDFEMEVGFGASFIHNEKMTLSLTGNLGFRVEVLSAEESIPGDTISTTYGETILFGGPQISFTYRFNPHVGLFADLGLFYNSGAVVADIDSDNGSITGNNDEKVSGYSCVPKLGVAFTF